MTAISYHGTINDLQGLSFADRGPFARPGWFALLEGAGHSSTIAVAREGADAVAFPLAYKGTGLVGLSNWYAFTWQPLATSGAGDPLYEALARGLADRASRITLDKLPDEDGTASRLTRIFAAAGWFVVMAPTDVNHVLPVGGRSYAQYLEGRPGALRTTLRRKGRKVAVRLLTDFEPDAWAQYEAVYAESWKPPEGDGSLLRRFAESESAAGRLRLGLATHDGEVVAAQFWTVDGGTAYIHKLAHRDSARSLSAGTTLSAALFEQVIDRDGVEYVDFGTGDDSYKRDWMELLRPRYRITCWRPADPRNWPAMARARLRQLVSDWRRR